MYNFVAYIERLSVKVAHFHLHHFLRHAVFIVELTNKGMNLVDGSRV